MQSRQSSKQDSWSTPWREVADGEVCPNPESPKGISQGPIDTFLYSGTFQTHTWLVKSKPWGEKVYLSMGFFPLSRPAGQHGPGNKKGFASLGTEAGTATEANHTQRALPTSRMQNIPGLVSWSITRVRDIFLPTFPPTPAYILEARNRSSEQEARDAF